MPRDECLLQRVAMVRIRYLTASEIVALYRIPIGRVYRLASEHQWRRCDRRNPALYLAADVDKTFRSPGSANSPQAG